MLFIDERLASPGFVNRRDLTEKFRISRVQAATDFRTFRELYPGRMVYNHKAHCYERGCAPSRTEEAL